MREPSRTNRAARDWRCVLALHQNPTRPPRHALHPDDRRKAAGWLVSAAHTSVAERFIVDPVQRWTARTN
jgi:hypothetical protein